jgi:hypothetical protein
MEITSDEIEDILKTGSSPEDIKSRLKQLFVGAKKSYSFSYTENCKSNDNCSTSMSVRGVVTIFIEQDHEDKIIYYGPWHCH